MKLPEFGVNRPVATAMLFIGVLTLGIVCLTKLGVDLTPEIEPTRVTVSTIWQGASCEDVEQKVTRVLEKRLGSVANLEEIRSTTSEGRSSITCEFAWGTNIDEASNDVRSKIDAVKRDLPEDVDGRVADPCVLDGQQGDHLHDGGPAAQDDDGILGSVAHAAVAVLQQSFEAV